MQPWDKAILNGTRSVNVGHASRPTQWQRFSKSPWSFLMRICFVCQSGVLEPKAILLAASLRLYFPIAAHPALAGPLQTETLKAFAALDVGKIPVRNPLRPDYPIGHKFAALMLLDGPDCGIFIDTDVLATTAPQLLPDSLAAVPASFNHHAKPVWEHVYNRFGLTLPLASPPTLVSRDRTAPYFNSGVIVVPGPVAKRLAASWIDTAMQIDGDPQVPDRSKRPNLSQLALPVAAARVGLGIEVLDPRWNFPAWSWRIAQEGVPILFHYQTMERLREEEPSLRVAMQAAEIHPSVRDALAAFSYI
jgi:hypothetical protein